MTLSRIALLVTCLSLGFGSVANAQEARGDVRAEARERFDRGLQLFNEHRYDASLAEFQRAYQISPNPIVLYNLGRVHAALGQSVEATDAFESYLSQDTTLNAQRRATVQQELERQRARVGRVHVNVNVTGATVAVDGIDVATTPLAAPLRLTVGAHTVGVRAPSYDSSQRAVTLAGGVDERLDFTLTQVVVRRGAVRVESTLRDVEVRVDGVSVGHTPLSETLSLTPGAHEIEGVRAGYTAMRSQVTVADAAEAVVHLDLVANDGADLATVGRVRIQVPHAPFTLVVDGREVAAASSLDLPIGAHELNLRVADREPVRALVTVEAGAPAVFAPELEWTPDARQSRVDSAATRRTVGWIGAGSGLALTLTSVGLWIWNENRVDSTQLATINRCDTIIPQPNCPTRPELMQMLSDYNASIDARDTMRLVVGIMGGVALAATAFFTIWALTAPSESDIDAAARAAISNLRLSAGLDRLQLSGAF